ncbi:MAG: beta/gamma crystallin-related protein [Pseudomonadota bacterium]
MAMVTRAAWIAAAITLGLPATSAAQRPGPGPGELTFYSQIGFRGQSYTVTGPRETIHIPWTVRSARLSGGSWQICQRSGYRGRCNEVNDTQGNIAWTVGSARPLRVGPPEPPPPTAGGSLRGMSAEFHPQPAERGVRVQSCASGAAACASEAADRFCRARGWTASSYERQETVSGRNYLADVLCTRTR